MKSYRPALEARAGHAAGRRDWRRRPAKMEKTEMSNAQQIGSLISALAALVAVTPEEAHGPIVAMVRSKIAEALRARGDLPEERVEVLADHLASRFETQAALAAAQPAGRA
jgi:hypothetical protein